MKTGAQVMFVRNDLSPGKRYFNGKIGTISRISGSDIRIQCPDDADEIVVERATWENIDYTLDQKTMEITEKTVGTFRQYPLRLAWAITIHKSQGLTFDKAIIDAQAAFAYGQVYVALSRCRTFEGMVLSTPLRSTAIKTDPAISRFSQQSRRRLPTADQLAAAKVGYQQQLIMDCFDFRQLRTRLQRLIGLLLGNAGVVQVSGVDDIRELQRKTEEAICTVGDNFHGQLKGLFSPTTLPAGDAVVVDRITRASAYFGEKIASGPGREIPDLQVDTDNKALKKKINSALRFLREEIDIKLAAVQSCRQGFSAARYFRAISVAAIGTEKKNMTAAAPVYSEADIAHPGMFQALKAWRSRKAEEEGIALYRVMHQKTLVQIAVTLPDTLPALKGIKGVGKPADRAVWRGTGRHGRGLPQAAQHCGGDPPSCKSCRTTARETQKKGPGRHPAGQPRSIREGTSASRRSPRIGGWCAPPLKATWPIGWRRAGSPSIRWSQSKRVGPSSGN